MKIKPQLSIFLLALTFISLILAGVFAYQNCQLRQKLETPIPKQEPSKENQPENLPPIPGANILINVIDVNGKLINKGTIEVSVEHEDEPYYNFNYSVNLTSIRYNLLGLHPPPSRSKATISMWVLTPTGEKSDVLVIKNDEFWEAVGKTQCDYVGKHQFDLGKEGETTNLIYSTQTQNPKTNLP